MPRCNTGVEPLRWHRSRVFSEGTGEGTCVVPPRPEALRLQIENSPSGAWGANCCQAATACFACDHGHSIENVETLPTGAGRNVNWVTTPKLPPPPPRRAQKRSRWCDGEA